jgi:hypothetical protein
VETVHAIYDAAGDNPGSKALAAGKVVLFPVNEPSTDG